MEIPPLVWKQMQAPEPMPAKLCEEDECYYLRDYTPGAGFEASQTNSLILNFKKSSSKKGKAEWKYKEKACHQFATELSALFEDDLSDFHITWIPSSKCKEDAVYCQRFELMFAILRRLLPKISVIELFKRTRSVEPTHSAVSRADEAMIASSLEWVPARNPRKHLVVIDDVVTTGRHFKVAKKMALEAWPDTNVIGVFWAKTVWPEGDDV